MHKENNSIVIKNEAYNDLVTFETAKLLSKMNFNENTEYICDCNGTFYKKDKMTNNEIVSETYYVPTIYSLQKWLHRNYGICTDVKTNINLSSSTNLAYDVSAFMIEDKKTDCKYVENVVSAHTVTGEHEDALRVLLYEVCLYVFTKLQNEHVKQEAHKRLIESYSNDWISINDKLPSDVLFDSNTEDHSLDLLLCYVSKRKPPIICIGYYSYNTNTFFNSTNNCMFPTTHWRLLPRLPSMKYC